MGELTPLGGGWSLWRDFAVRSAGFPVGGLDIFGPGDESARLREVARGLAFQEAVTWQNPAALENAVLRVAAGAATKPSRARQREEIVASYWQRYCGKNDTIGFFGPLAWGRIADEGPPLRVRSGPLVRERVVHLEAWGVQALAEELDPAINLAAGPHAERELRAVLEKHPDPAVRQRGLTVLARLEAGRDDVAAAPRDGLRTALAALDATFVELTGREAQRNAGRAYGARTLCYVDCLRDLDVTVGPALVDDLAPALRTLFEAGRWYCGQVHEIGRRIVEDALPDGHRAPFAPVLRRVMQTLMELPPAIGDELAAFQARLSMLTADPDPATIGARAAAAFADHHPAWRRAVHHSVDVQLAAPDEAAVERGEHLAVIGDVHPGANPLMQGVFAHRHPDPGGLLARVRAQVGRGVPLLLPPFGPGLGVDARGAPLTPPDDIHLAVMPETRAQAPRRTWLPDELFIEGDELVDRRGALRVSLLDVFGMAIFIAAVRSFELLPEEPHTRRITIGRTVLRREGWSVPAQEVAAASTDVAGLGRDRGMPRRLFAKSPLERKPMYLDLESPALTRILCRHARQAAEADPAARISFTEMLPLPEACWLRDDGGDRYVSELRIVAVDETRDAGRGVRS